MITRRLRALLATAPFAAALLSAGCLPDNGDTGGETHWRTGWLSACSADADCAAGFECLSHVCTIRCSDVASCADFDHADCVGLDGVDVCLVAGCGNGILDPGEQCDDANVVAGDGCAPDCRLEDGSTPPRPDATADTTGPDATTDTTGSIDAVADTFWQQDVSADTTPRDDTFAPPPDASEDTGPSPITGCGDWVVEPGEECDDGNHIAGDGCSVDCRVERCGNGVIDPGEQCDDANNQPADGCAPDCHVESCGNAIVDPGEQCDDGNVFTGDGCSPECTLE